jgi:menaquinone-dependent protoporphyrinogen oxidase
VLRSTRPGPSALLPGCAGSYRQLVMCVLVAHASKRDGTAGLAQMIAEGLTAHGIEVDVRAARDVWTLKPYAGVIVAGALYHNRWHRDARWFVHRYADQLRVLPVWLMSGGPLDDTVGSGTLPPVPQVKRIAAEIGARGCITFGGRPEPDAKGFPADAMAERHAGDWRDPEQVRGFVLVVVADLAAVMRRAS